MNTAIIIRVMSNAGNESIQHQGRSRVEIDGDKSYGEFLIELENRLNVAKADLQLFADQQYKKKITNKENIKINKVFRNGDMIFVKNQGTSINFGNTAEMPKLQTTGGFLASGKQVSMKDDDMMIDTRSHYQDTPMQQQEQSDCKHGKMEKCLNCLGVTKENAQFIKERCKHGPNDKCPSCIGLTSDSAKQVQYQCKHGPNEKCPNCFTKDFISDAKHISFEHFISELKAKCKGTHKEDQKCQNCLPALELSYKVDYKCPKHKPFPEGMCNKCIPPAVVMNRQKYRHVDYVSFMNIPELQNFVNYWQSKHCMEQRVGYLYGYYSEDPNYPDGIRVNVEAVYEPPQFGEVNGYQDIEDENRYKVDMIAEALTLERVGIIFTSINSDTFLSSHEIRKIAVLQEQHRIQHPAGMSVSKQVTVVIKPKGDGSDIGTDCYMVSDQCQAMERDNCFGNSEMRKTMVIRETGPDDMVPQVLQEGKAVTEFDPDFFIVSLANGQPKKCQDFSILKNYRFPVANRENRATNKDWVNFQKQSKSEGPTRRFADFHALVYLVDLLDLETALTLARLVAEEKAPSADLVDLLESFK